jgi:hypothetical protein
MSTSLLCVTPVSERTHRPAKDSRRFSVLLPRDGITGSVSCEPPSLWGIGNRDTKLPLDAALVGYQAGLRDKEDPLPAP